jgi:hypothetical protein
MTQLSSKYVINPKTWNMWKEKKKKKKELFSKPCRWCITIYILGYSQLGKNQPICITDGYYYKNEFHGTFQFRVALCPIMGKAHV